MSEQQQQQQQVSSESFHPHQRPVGGHRPNPVPEPKDGRDLPSADASPAVPLAPFSFPVVPTAVLRALLDTAQRSKLTAVVAPIGYGKSVLLSTLYRSTATPAGQACWCCLDDRDEQLERLLERLELALARLQRESAAAIPLGGLPDAERIARLVARLRRWPGPLTIYIDNLHYCQDGQQAQLLEALVKDTPPQLSLVCSSASALPLATLDYKLQGLLAEYGAAELSFAPDEVRALLGEALCARLDEAGLQAIMTRTEGWPAAVRLMQILLASASDPARTLAELPGLDRDIDHLLSTQVLNDFAPRLRAFLLRLAPLRDFDAALAAEATGEREAETHLNYLWRHNVFLIPAASGRRYRLHNLFREFLRTQAERELPLACRQEILARAARHCEQRAWCADAIDYALASGSIRLAADMLERTAPIFVRDLGYLRRYLAWLGQLHAAGEYGGWEADYWYVWALVFRRRYGQAREELSRLGERLDAAREATPQHAQAMARRLEIIRIVIGVYTDRLSEARCQAEQWLTASDLLGGTCIDAPFDIATVASAAAICATNEGQLAEARRLVRHATAAIAQSESAYGKGWVAAVEALLTLREGDYATAYQGLTEAMARVSCNLGDHAGVHGTLALLAAKAAVEMDLRSEAKVLLQQGMYQISSHGLVDTAAHGLDAALKLWPGVDSPWLSLTRLREIAASHSPRLGLMLGGFIVRRLLQLGRLMEARQEAAVLGLPLDGTAPDDEHNGALRHLLQAAQLELALATGQLKQASRELAEQTQQARSQGRSGRLVELALDEAQLQQCMTQRASPSARCLTRAVSLAARRRYLRPFRDRQDVVASLVNDTRPKDWPFVTEQERRFFAEVCGQLKVSHPALDQAPEQDGHQAPSETPTSRELELLRLIEAGLSNQDIADRLSLSLATVKWHLYNLYAKLGVKSRAAALARARALNLLPW